MFRSSVLRVFLLVLRRCAYASLRTALIVFLPCLFLSNTSIAQESDAVDVVRISTDLIVFPVRVVDKERRSVLGVSAADFVLKDQDGITSAPYFAAGTGRVAMLFALDESGSLREVISQQHDAAISLFSHFKERSRISALRFAKEPKLVAPFDTDVDAVRAAFSFSAQRDSRTAIFDGAKAAVAILSQLPVDVGERRIVILISDGLDNASHAKAVDVIGAANEVNVSFYVIHIPLFAPKDGHLSVRPATKGFRELGEKTGGKYFLAGDVKSALLGTQKSDLTPIFRAIEDDLRSQYLLGFYLGERSRDGRRHRVAFTIKREGLVYSTTQNRRFAKTHQFLVDTRLRRALATP
jgi:Ca-activated chloride channel family protein